MKMAEKQAHNNKDMLYNTPTVVLSTPPHMHTKPHHSPGYLHGNEAWFNSWRWCFLGAVGCRVTKKRERRGSDG